MSKVNTARTELACNKDGCVLMMDDGNPDNDIMIPEYMYR